MTLEKFEGKMGEGVPLRRITPLVQIANIAVLLASDLAAGMTATVVNGTGGAQVD
jgi:enoyl-[acyl-carrier-protein] reductase (NADH)